MKIINCLIVLLFPTIFCVYLRSSQQIICHATGCGDNNGCSVYTGVPTGCINTYLPCYKNLTCGLQNDGTCGYGLSNNTIQYCINGMKNGTFTANNYTMPTNSTIMNSTNPTNPTNPNALIPNNSTINDTRSNHSSVIINNMIPNSNPVISNNTHPINLPIIMPPLPRNITRNIPVSNTTTSNNTSIPANLPPSATNNTRNIPVNNTTNPTISNNNTIGHNVSNLNITSTNPRNP